MTVLNVPVVSLYNIIAKEWNFRFIAKYLVKNQLRKQDIFTTQKVGDLLFSGYQDKFIKQVVEEENLLKFMHLSMPNALDENHKFSLMNKVIIFLIYLDSIR